ncbi:MAG: glycyl-radical enzyme activating protein [Chloroflexi bacterium]|nr:glycyl-radical enzyme activating protein [Chloroflexota bacterium]
MKDSGIIFNIQRFSVHDGPGIRTTVFFKGCPLRCAWCANPESQAMEPQLIVRDVKCQSCGKCVAACPRKAITQGSNGARIIHWEHCDQCLACVDACIYGALNIAGKRMAVAEVAAEAERDKPFYKNSGGGVTLSGGEPLSQPEFCLTLASTLKDRGLHVALDTSGYMGTDNLVAILPYVDLVLFDIKHLDPQQHKKYTGVDNALMLENLNAVAGRTKIWLRVPLIAGINDSQEHTRQVAELAKKVRADKVSLLPYHEGGKSKSHQVGKRYALRGQRIPDKARVEEPQASIINSGVDAAIGH